MFPRFNGGSGRPVGEHIVSIKGHQLALMLESRAAVWKRMRVYITLSHLISLRTGGKARREEGRDGMGWDGMGVTVKTSGLTSIQIPL